MKDCHDMPSQTQKDSPGKNGATRRRGAALETALLQVAWEQLAAGGFANFTIESVAQNAGTSRPVIYRRWQSRTELASAALAFQLAQNPVEIPDLGSLRAELISVLQQSVDRGALNAAVITRDIIDICREAGTTLAAVRESIMGEEGDLLDRIIKRAIARGELTGEGLTPRKISLARDLLRHEYMLTMMPPSREVIEEVVDDIVLPLLTLDAREKGTC
ncbi:MAG: TetR/AcrR family transcriptional regulator [Caenibius sp.]